MREDDGDLSPEQWVARILDACARGTVDQEFLHGFGGELDDEFEAQEGEELDVEVGGPLEGESDGADAGPGVGLDGWLASWPLMDGERVAVAVRSGRRRLGWSQRDLARQSGVSQATIARLEAGSEGRFGAVVATLAACGLLVTAVPPPGSPGSWRVVPHPADEGRDSAGRRLPAHLPAYPTSMVPAYTLWKRMVRGEDLFAERPPHWLYLREPWPAPPDEV